MMASLDDVVIPRANEHQRRGRVEPVGPLFRPRWEPRHSREVFRSRWTWTAGSMRFRSILLLFRSRWEPRHSLEVFRSLGLNMWIFDV